MYARQRLRLCAVVAEEHTSVVLDKSDTCRASCRNHCITESSGLAANSRLASDLLRDNNRKSSKSPGRNQRMLC